MSKILITGATGFGGRYLVDRLQSAGYEVHGLSKRGQGTSYKHVEHAIDLIDSDALNAVVSDIRPDGVIHLAAITHVAHQSIEELYRVNVVGTRNLLNAVANYAPAISSVIVASSGLVYGNQCEGVIDEGNPLLPVNDYGISKLATEHLARVYARIIPVTCVRPFNYTGVGQTVDFIVPKIVSHAARGVRRIELGNLDVARDFSDVRVVADVYARLLTCQQAIGDTFNICSGEATSIRQILHAVEAITKKPLEVTVNPGFIRPNEVISLCGSKARLEALIGTIDMPPIDETIEWMVSSGFYSTAIPSG
jgi:nucleoside-diphosphate-sugar epimerase